MSYDEWGNSPAPRRSGFGFGRLLLFALLAFIAIRYFSNLQQQREFPAAPQPEINVDDWEMSAEPARPKAGAGGEIRAAETTRRGE